MELLTAYWSQAEIEINLLIFANLVGALILGAIVGYERHFHGRAAGMRTYGLVCMTSAGLTIFAGYPQYWYAGQHAATIPADPTRVVQGIVTGVGFLGAGVIMKDGMTISGLTTAASIWTSCAIGILVGIGFYGAAILLAGLASVCMMYMSRIEKLLPAHPAISVDLTFRAGYQPDLSAIRARMAAWGYELAIGSFAVTMNEQSLTWHFVVQALDIKTGESVAPFSSLLSQLEDVVRFEVVHARN